MKVRIFHFLLHVQAEAELKEVREYEEEQRLLAELHNQEWIEAEQHQRRLYEIQQLKEEKERLELIA
jgi:hypothetical protein